MSTELGTGFALVVEPGEVRREDVGPGRDPRFGKLDRAAKLLALGAARALAGRALVGERTGVVLASFTGCLAADERFDETRARPEGPSPALFPATLPTAPAAELSIRLGLGGPVFSVRAGIRTALALALSLVRAGDAELVLACGLEVPASGDKALLGIDTRESVSVFVVDHALAGRVRVPVTDTLDLPRGPLLANEDALALARELGL
jgi:hypothetical protein